MCRKPFVNTINSYTRIQILTYIGILRQLHEIKKKINKQKYRKPVKVDTTTHLIQYFVSASVQYQVWRVAWQVHGAAFLIFSAASGLWSPSARGYTFALNSPWWKSRKCNNWIALPPEALVNIKCWLKMWFLYAVSDSGTVKLTFKEQIFCKYKIYS